MHPTIYAHRSATANTRINSAAEKIAKHLGIDTAIIVKRIRAHDAMIDDLLAREAIAELLDLVVSRVLGANETGKPVDNVSTSRQPDDIPSPVVPLPGEVVETSSDPAEPRTVEPEGEPDPAPVPLPKKRNGK